MLSAESTQLPEVRMRPGALQLFRYSAVTWNGHRVHFDQAWASHEGHAGLLIHSHLHAANAIRTLTDGLGVEWELKNVDYRVVRPAVAGTMLIASARIVDRSDDGDTLTFALRETDDQGEICLEGTAVAVKRANGGAVSPSPGDAA